MSTTIYLVRHAEAEGNIGRRCHGQYDSMLTKVGRKQAKTVGDRFRTIRLDAVYSSDLSRARYTAKAIADPHGLTVQTRPALREINLGNWEDKPWEELKVFHPEQYDVWCTHIWDFRTEGSETIEEAGRRVLDGLRLLAKENDGKTIAAVSHGTVTRGVLALAMGLPIDQLMKVGWGDNTCVARLVFLDDGSIRVDYTNDVGHLPPELSTFRKLKWSAKVDVPVSPQGWFRPVNWEDPEDKALALDLFHEIWHPTYGAENWPDDRIEEQLKSFQQVTPEAAVFILIEGKPAGVIALKTTMFPDGPIGEMGGTGILKDYRGCGLGPQLIEHAVSVYRRMGKTMLEARPLAERPMSMRFYQAYGFERVGTDGRFAILQRNIDPA